MKEMMRAYRLLNVVSVDVACGAVVCAAFFANIFSVRLRIFGFAALGLTVWIIYTVDHLLDARRLETKALTLRHQFHQEYFRILTVVMIIAVVLDIYCIMHIRKPVFSWGLALAAIVIVYLLLQRWLSPFKEIIAAILYSCGVLLPTLSLATHPVSNGEMGLIVSFLLTAFINLILFSMYDEEKDSRHTQSSFVILFGKRNTSRLLRLLFFLQTIIFTGLVIMSSYRAEVLILGVMNAVLFVLFVFSEHFKRDDHFRLVGDIIFFFPLPYLIINGQAGI